MIKIELTENDYAKQSSKILYEKICLIQKNKKGDILIGLSGGSTPIPVYKLLFQMNLEWERIHFFIVDERCVPNDDIQSNYRNIVESIKCDNLKINLHSVIQQSFSFEECSMKYENHIISFFNSEYSKCKFDLILLGMGLDGHTASLFPNTEALNEKKKLVVFNALSLPSAVDRITFTYPLILKADEILLLIRGKEKNEFLEKLISDKNNEYPISRVLFNHPNITILK